MYSTVALVTLVAILFHWFILKKFSYWRKLGFPHLPGYFPFGTSKDLTLGRKYQGLMHQQVYKQLSPNPYGGIYIWNEPILFIRDPEIIRQVLVKGFQHFRDRGRVEFSKKDPYAQHLFSLDGEIWRELRLKISPTFTSGRLKHMFSLLVIAAKKYEQLLLKVTEQGDSVNIKDITTCFTLDSITSCAFGLESNTAENEEFRKISQSKFISYIPILRKVKHAIYIYFPFMRPYINLCFMNKKLRNLLNTMFMETISYREQNNVRRNDFLDLMIQLKNRGKLENDNVDQSDAGSKSENGSLEITIDHIIAQCFLFFAAGFEGSSSSQSLLFYELAKNQDIQNRLHKEIDEVTRKHGGNLDYEALTEMHYLDQILSEVLRKYPTIPFLERKCSKNFRLPDNPNLIVEQGIKILIPVYSLHYDPKYFPNPDKFDPERFSPENKSSIVPFTYLPFGEGPRYCVGTRFALLQTKMGICTLLRSYKVKPAKDTPNQLQFVPTTFLSITGGPINLLIKRRDD